jgi:hypothetical protein
MDRKAPDTHFYAELRDMNLEFLGLVARGGRPPGGSLFGLDAAVVDQVARFSAAQLEAMAGTPCLLAGFRAAPPRVLARVAEPSPGESPLWAEQARVFAASLLTYTSQMARRDPLRAALCTGPAMDVPAAGLRFRDIQGYANRALLHLEARFCRHPRFWPDLVRTAREGHAARLELARLTAIQLASAEVGASRRPVPVARAANTR